MYLSHLTGSLDGEIPSGVLPSERRSGRKGRRRSSAKLSEGRYQVVSCGKEGVKIEKSAAEMMQKDQVRSQDDGLSCSGKFVGLLLTSMYNSSFFYGPPACLLQMQMIPPLVYITPYIPSASST